MDDRRSETLRGIGALLAVLILTIGPPVALALIVGWPLPASVPNFADISTAARSGIDETVIVKTLAILGWLVWGQIALAITVEGVARLRGRPAHSVPVARGLQLAATQLLATAAVLFGSLTTSGATPVPLSTLTSIELSQPIDWQPVERLPPLVLEPIAFREQPGHPSTEPTDTYVVERHDSWWGIADSELGDGRRWQELRDLNVGRSMPDGQAIEPGTETLAEGWVLLLPNDDPLRVDLTPPASSAGRTVVVVEPGDNLWDLAEHCLEENLGRQAGDGEILPYWQVVIEANRDVYVEADDPSLIYPGQAIRLPGPQPPDRPDRVPAAPNNEPAPEAPRPQPAEPVVPPTTQVPSTTTSAAPTTTTTAVTSSPATAPSADPQQTAAEEDGSATTLPNAGALGVAGAVLAVGVARAVRRRRLRRSQILPPGVRASDPPESLDNIRAVVAREADGEQVDRLGRATTWLAADLAARPSPARVRLVQASSDRIEVLLSEPVQPAAAGWVPEGSGAVWALDNPPSCPDVNERVAHPTLVSVGRPDEAGQLYLDLETEGIITVTGEPDAATDLLRSMVLELSTSPLATDVSVIICGDLLGPSQFHLDHVRVASRWEEVADDVLAWAHQTCDLLADGHWPHPAAARAATEHSELSPLVLLLSEHLRDDRFSELCALISASSAPIAILGLDTSIAGATEIDVRSGEVRIPALGLVCEAQTVSEDAASEVVALLADAEEMPSQLSFSPVEPEDQEADSDPDPPDTTPYVDPPYDILVRCLGDIEVVGGHRSLTAKQTAVVTYVALHSPVAAERVEDAVWSAPTASRRKRLANTISECRSVLGSAHLPVASDGRYRTGERIATDLELFERRLTYSRSQGQPTRIGLMREALDLVSGPVFTYRNADRASFVWIDTENWISAWELTVTRTASDLANLCLEVGDLDGAAWAARRGLQASPTDARLTRSLMAAYAAGGNVNAAAQVYESHVAALEQLELDDVDPDLLDAYEELRRHGQAATAG